MAEGTRHAQLAKAMSMLKGETLHLREEQDTQKHMLEAVLQQLSNLANSYEQLAMQTCKHQMGEGSSNTQAQFNNNPLFEGSRGIHAKTLRLDFPKFNGSKPMEWILKAEQFFEYFNTLDEHKLQISSFHMEGKTLSWYFWLRDSGPIRGWEDFISALKVRFEPFTYDNPIVTSTKLRQTTTVEDYQTEFEALSNKMKGLMEEEVIRRNKGGPNGIQNQTSSTHPYLPKLPTPPPLLKLPPPLPKPENTSLPNTNNPNRKPTIPIKRISPAQM
ncbi:hypothetical protein I3760_03G141200 [Carya illinoinensis]|nr:hypothetical protein I3760_03G141200 [Carya illinoinensis]